MLEDFAEPGRWVAVASGQADLKIVREGDASGDVLRLDFDFHGGSGFVVARRPLSMPMPEDFTFDFRVRGASPPNHFEFKLEDDSGQNVWRWRRENYEFPKEWTHLVLNADDVEFAWGPAGGGGIRRLGAIEFAIAAGSGGKGSGVDRGPFLHRSRQPAVALTSRFKRSRGT